MSMPGCLYTRSLRLVFIFSRQQQRRRTGPQLEYHTPEGRRWTVQGPTGS